MPTTADISALLVPIVAVFGLWIAYRQWRTAQNRLKLDLFDRRLIVYEAAREIIVTVRTSGKVTNEAEFKYFANTRGAIWLFNPEIVRYLDEELWRKIVDLGALESELEGLPAGEERSKNVREQRVIKNWLGEQLGVMEKKFAPFLKLRH
jgi:hypothetical protein